MAHNSGQRPQLLGSRHIGTDQGDIQTNSPHSILSGDGDASGEHLSTPPQVRDRFFAPDWHPSDHPLIPSIVSVGRKPDVPACAYCHRVEGAGGPESASLAGTANGFGCCTRRAG